MSFASIKDRIWKKFQGWKEKLFARAGKEVLIKSVAQAIPNYAMSCFKLPTTFCNEIESIISKLWWGSSGGKNGIHWKNRGFMCRPKVEGGLGFHNFEAFNEGILAKQLWRLYSQPHSLLARIYKARYHPHACLWEVGLGATPSYDWRSIMGARQLLIQRVRWRIGNGKCINIWQDRWLGGEGSGRVITPTRLLHENACVSTLIDENNGCWRDDLIKKVFFAVDYERIKSIHISRRLPEDKLCWVGGVDGEFRVREAYRLAMEDENNASSSTGFDPVWKQLRRVAWDILPYNINLRMKRVMAEVKCVRCDAAENTVHVLRDCEWGRHF